MRFHVANYIRWRLRLSDASLFPLRRGLGNLALQLSNVRMELHFDAVARRSDVVLLHIFDMACNASMYILGQVVITDNVIRGEFGVQVRERPDRAERLNETDEA